MGAQPATLQSGLVAATAVDRHHSRRPRRSPRRPPEHDLDRRQLGDDLRHRDRHRRRRRRRGRSLDRRRRDLAPGHRDDASWTYSVDRRTAPRRRRSRPVRSTTSGNIGAASAARTVTSPAPARSSARRHPGDRRLAMTATRSSSGVKFRSDVAGTISGIRFYKAAANTGTHVGSLWTRERHAAGPGDLHRRDRVRLAAGELRQPGRDPAEHHLRRRLLRPEGPLLRRPSLHLATARRSGQHPRQPAAARPSPTAATATGSTSYTQRSTFPHEHLPGGATTGSTSLFTPTGPTQPPGQVTNVSATAGSAAGDRQLDRRRRPAARRRATGSPPTSAPPPQTPITVTAPASSKTITGLTGGTTYTFTVTADQRSRQRADVGAVERGDADVAEPRPAPRPASPPALGLCRRTVNWTAPSKRRRQRDHRLPDHPLRRLDRADADRRAGAGHLDDGHRADQRHDLHLQGRRDQRRSGPARSRRLERRHPDDTIFDFATPATIDSGDAHAVELGVKFSSDVAGTVTGIRFYKAAANTGTHIGSLWTAAGALLARRPSPARPPPAGSRSTSRPRWRSPPTRPMSPATWRPKVTTRPPPRVCRRRSTTRRCTPSPTRAPTASTLQPNRHPSRPALQRHQLLGRRHLRPTPTPRPGR